MKKYNALCLILLHILLQNTFTFIEIQQNESHVFVQNVYDNATRSE